MAVDQLPGKMREFANYLDGLLARLDHGAGWCAVFWQRDPDGMQACLDGREVPPWDVVQALLQDLAAQHGTAFVAPEVERARSLHAAAHVAYDARPGGRAALGDRLDAMLREQKYAAERQADLGRLLASAATREEAEALRTDLAWARDDHERAAARCVELRSRITDLDRRAGAGQTRDTQAVRRDLAERPFRLDAVFPAGETATGSSESEAPTGFPEPAENHGSGGSGSPEFGTDAREFGAAPHEHHTDAREFGAVTHEHGDRAPAAVADPFSLTQAPAPPASEGPVPPPPALSTPAPKQRKRRRGSARFAGMVEEAAVAPVVVPPSAQAAPSGLPVPPPTATGRRTLRGARFAGAAAEPVQRPQPPAESLDAAAMRETAETVARLVRLRGEGRSGEAHALLAEIAYWPAARYPLLAAELQHAGLGADWATLLWEAGSLPADRLVAAANALAAAGRTADGEQILRQGVVRPAEEIGEAVRVLAAEGRRRELRALLDAFVRVRTPEEAARGAAPDPQTLVPLLLEAAGALSEQRRRELVHALRVAGLTA